VTLEGAYGFALGGGIAFGADGGGFDTEAGSAALLYGNIFGGAYVRLDVRCRVA
jgi:hypothetical protein